MSRDLSRDQQHPIRGRIPHWTRECGGYDARYTTVGCVVKYLQKFNQYYYDVIMYKIIYFADQCYAKNKDGTGI